MYQGQSKTLRILSQGFVYGLAIIWLMITVYPFIFLFQNSMKASTEFYRASVWALPGRPPVDRRSRSRHSSRLWAALP